ncbi:acyl-CoA dehydrogenase family protein [Mycobacterium sp. 94-17]|uniref:acyl-CoA dehydrogenase family protein n=1 Tax=Mycobacterium sp. 94-17 TaxID=2986147 RepID=UPI002D1E6A15|nr:acyl-CoA dehydrogenase family protein [Mycobacterium sp. 94-17]MEB4209748.1 acyl-CoA dehydrogenase family protein [Mycobacterium sp. 94-17]
MDFADAPDVAEFRAALRRWLASVTIPDAGAVGYAESNRPWYRTLAEAGYVGVSLPTEFGGRGLPASYEAVVNEELAAAGAPAPPPVGHIAHAIADFANDELRARFLPGLLDCSQWWCQGFSEPGAGSDLAAIRTSARASDDGMHFIVDGHKIWTSGAQWSRWCLLLARTEADQPRHGGLSMLVVDMESPGIQALPITMATGGNEFAEVYFDGVRVDAANLIGERGQGWAIAMQMLVYERGPADMGWVARFERDVTGVEDDIRTGRLVADDVARRALAAGRVGLRVLHWHVLRSLAARERDTPSEESSIGKLLATRVEQSLYHTIADIRGADLVRNAADDVNDFGAFNDYVYSRAQSVYGGTQQVQRNIVAQRLLGLPRG